MQVGDTVQLKSGGPFMTVGKVDYTDIQCLWFDSSDHLAAEWFRKDMLVQRDGKEGAKFGF